MDFLLCMEDPVEILEGTLHIDIHAKHVRDVDDGLSVIGYLDDWNESQAQLQTALQTIETITDKKNSLNRDLQSVRDEFYHSIWGLLDFCLQRSISQSSVQWRR
ncbi:unnamed protein product [Cylindrotheca closterium]|uniref:Uncharacterized protein n=1 Tax=Cylindrotheca closterium TaxID=2856 RepID=A0AAD2CJQ2_9STRA|nr:unnamed protein product [Cylindrotheca closterium]